MEARIRRNIIILLVVTFVAIVGMCAGWFFVLVRPQREEIAKVDTQYQDFSAKAGQLKAAYGKQREAEDRLDYLTGEMAFFRGSDENRAMGGLYRRLYFYDPQAGTDVEKKAAQDRNWRAWMNEYHYAFGPAFLLEIIEARNATRVGVPLPKIEVDDPPQMPEQVKIPTNGFLKPLAATNNGTVELKVTGTFGNILRFMDKLNRSSILMVLGNVKLEGYSPRITATFPVTPYLIASGPGAKISLATGGGDGDAAGPDPAGKQPDGAAPPEKTEAMMKIKNPRLGR